MAIVRSTRRLLIALLTLPLACGSDEGPPLTGTSGGHIDDEELPTPTLVCPGNGGDQAFPEMVPLEMAKAQSVDAINGVAATNLAMRSER
jgi:hypothetical protein